jgi:hypothetical protein
MNPRKYILAIGIIFVFVVCAVVAWFALKLREGQPASATPIGEPVLAVSGETRKTAVTPIQDDAERWAWGRAAITWDPEHWPPNRSDWSDDPSAWVLRPVREVREIPQGVQLELERLDCAIPKSQYAELETSVVWGEFERTGQRDLAILCVHSDKSSSTYLFWGGEAQRRETMPESGSSINTKLRTEVEKRVDLSKPREPDMPLEVTHDGIEIGCCECCSMIFYRHGGHWFTLPGAD